MSGIVPPDEHDRLQRMYTLHLLDHVPDEGFRSIVRLARQLLKVPLAALALVDRHRLYFLAEEGMQVLELPREQTFCAYTIQSAKPLMVTDAWRDPRFRELPLVAKAPFVRSYLGIPLLSGPVGSGVGTLFVLDVCVREFEQQEQHMLRDLALLAERALHLHLVEQAWQANMRSQLLIDNEGCIRRCNPAAEQVVGHPETSLLRLNLSQLIHPEDRPSLRSLREQLGHTGARSAFKVVRLLQRSGEPKRLALELVHLPQLPRLQLCQLWELGDLQRLTEQVQPERALRELLSRDRNPQEPDGMLNLPESAEPRPCFQGQQILLVEDHPLNAEIAMTILQSLNLRVTWVEHGGQALQKLRETPPPVPGRPSFDLVLMDLQMPVMDGLTCVRLLRALPDPTCALLPVIAMTAHSSHEDREKSLAAGMNEHLKKPLEPALLAEVLARFLRRAPEQGAEEPAISSEAEQLKAVQAITVPLAVTLDILGALRRLRGNMVQLRLLLRRFLQRYEQEVLTWSKPDRLSDPTFLRARLHDIKGASYTLGLKSLGELAMQLEQRLKEGGTLQQGDLECFQAHLRETQHYLEREGLLVE